MNPSDTAPEPRLPVELLFIVKEHIPLSDLRTHVCFYNTCRTIAAFYGDNSEQNAFWRRSCALSGIGWLKGDSSWKEIAFETIAKDGFCAHPSCGGALLDWNAASVSHAMRLYDWDPEDGPWDASFDEVAHQWTYSYRPVPICSPIFRHIGLSNRLIPPWYSKSVDMCLLPEPSGIYLRNTIAAHPVATRSFATFPSVRQMIFHYRASTYGSPAQGAMGTTVWDVLRSLQHDLDRDLTVKQLFHLTAGPFDPVFRDRVSTDFAGDLEKFTTLRGLLAVSRWEGIHFIRSDESGPIFRSTFSPLPTEDISEGRFSSADET